MAVGVRQEVDMAHSGTVYAFSLHTAYCRTLYTYMGGIRALLPSKKPSERER